MGESWGPWLVEILGDQHDLSEFRCGKPELDQWLLGQAMRAHVSDTARTYVWTHSHGRVGAYFSVAPTQVRRDDVPRSASGGVS